MVRAMMTVSGLTLVSRILGFLRDILIARFLGTGPVADAFVAAFRFPNMFRRIFGEGAYNAAFVPLFGRKVEEEGTGAAVTFARNTFSALVWVLGILTLVAIPCMHWVMMVVVPGFLPKFEQDLGDIGGGQAFFERKINTSGAKEIHFQVSGDTREAVGHWSGRLELKNMSLSGPEANAVPLLVRMNKREAEIVLGLDGPVLSSAGLVPLHAQFSPNPVSGVRREPVDLRQPYFIDEGEVIEKVTFGLAPGGRGWVKLPGDHRFESFHVNFNLDPSEAGGQRATLRVFRNHPDNFAQTVALSRIMFCYLFFMALVAHLSGVLNTFKRFAMPAAAPILLNVVLVCALGWIWLMRWEGDLRVGKTLAWGVAIAGMLQFLALWVACAHARAAMLVHKPVWNPELKKMLLLMGPGVIAAGIQQVNLLVGGIIASFQQGAIATLYYADRVNQLPLGMVGIALGVVLLPEVTRRLRSGREDEAAESIRRGMELAMLLTLPAAAAMIAIHEPLIGGLFQGEKFDADDVSKTGWALAGFALGLPGYVLVKVLQPAYFARENTKGPMLMAGVAVAVNIVCSLILFNLLRPTGYGHVGIAIATAISAWVNVILLWRGMGGFVRIAASEWRKLARMVLASVLMGGTVWVAAWALGPWLAGSQWQKMVGLALIVGTGMAVYGLLALVLRATSLAGLRASFGKKE
ncbi:MAG: murein biosynthesis integral membrane protein MurJ [Roseibacillus sp.]|nr:murein biosynthesis integral membrane protein MurJ [Roseibacillus sp.]